MNHIELTPADRADAAVQLRVPMSGIPELDAMIREARRLDMATAAMQGMLADLEFDPQVSEVAVRSDNVADALLAASEPKKADPLRPTDDELWDQTLRERDEYHEMADRLANAVAERFGVEIGEHSNANCPWENALDVLESEPDKPQPDAEGWIEWNGGECPVATDQVVRARLRNGGEHVGAAGYFLWAHLDDDDIIAYRVVK